MLHSICISSTIPSLTRQSEAAKEITAGTAGTLTNIRRKKIYISSHLSGAKRRHDRNPHQAAAPLLAALICSPSSPPTTAVNQPQINHQISIPSITRMPSKSISHNKSTRVGSLSTNCLCGGWDGVFPEQLH